MATAQKSSRPISKKLSGKKTSPETTTQPATKKKTASINIKYADKSAGQPEMVVIFENIRQMLLPYDKKGALVLHAQTGGQLNLVSHKEVEIAGSKRSELWFTSALIQKGYVGFYFMPIYGEKELGKKLSPEFMKCLKGKACFHIKQNDPKIMNEIKKALKLGYTAYKERGWL